MHIVCALSPCVMSLLKKEFGQIRYALFCLEIVFAILFVFFIRLEDGFLFRIIYQRPFVWRFIALSSFSFRSLTFRRLAFQSNWRISIHMQFQIRTPIRLLMRGSPTNEWLEEWLNDFSSCEAWIISKYLLFPIVKFDTRVATYILGKFIYIPYLFKGYYVDE